MKRKLISMILAVGTAASLLNGCGTADAAASSEAASSSDAAAGTSYAPVTITVDLERSGLGDKIEETFDAPPTHVVAKGDQMADYFFDLGLQGNMAGYTHGSCHSTVSQYPARSEVKVLGTSDDPNTITKEELLSTGCDFLIGWDSTFSDKNFNKDFCQEHGISMYTPYCTSDSATFDDIYKDYETLGKIFNVSDLAAQKVDAMKATISSVKSTLGDSVYDNPVSVFVYDSGEDSPFTACQGMPGDIIKLAGGLSIFSDIDKGWDTVSWEQVVERNPSVILILDYDGDTQEKEDFLYSNEALKSVDAVRNKRIYSACCSDMQGSAGSAGTVKQLAQEFYPDLFK